MTSGFASHVYRQLNYLSHVHTNLAIKLVELVQAVCSDLSPGMPGHRRLQYFEYRVTMNHTLAPFFVNVQSFYHRSFEYTFLDQRAKSIIYNH